MAEIEVSDIESDNSQHEDTLQPPKKKPKVYKQKYNYRWEKESQLKCWLAPVHGDPYRAFCKVCKKELIAGLSELKRHAVSKKHLKIEQSIKSSQPITSMVTQDTTSKQVKRAEIKVASFSVEHNLPFNVMDHLSDLVTDIFPDSEIAARFKCKHTKARSVLLSMYWLIHVGKMSLRLSQKLNFPLS